MSTVLANPALDLTDIQGNILRGYRFPVVRYVFFGVTTAPGGQRFLRALLPAVTTAEHWGAKKMASTLNVACTWRGLAALGLPSSSLATFPEEFREGMPSRASSQLADWGPSAPERWEPMWLDGSVHVLVAINALTEDLLVERFNWLLQLAGETRVTLVGSQDGGQLTPTGQEHFGFEDGLANPTVAGSGQQMQPGSGKLMPDGTWAPIAAGEFLLGHRDEAGEVPVAPEPRLLARNSTYLVYRKLHQNVATFRRFIAEEGQRYAGGSEMLAAKIMGRWRDATPLELSPDRPNPAIAGNPAAVNAFNYGGDPDGARCPVGAHVRRANPRDSIEFSSLVNRRRLMRRGIPYGAWTPLSEPGDDDGDHGLIFVALNASILRQFEFVQREWLNYGNDFRLGNTPDPLVGTHTGTERAIINGDPGPPLRPVHICTGLPSFVETRGGDYFFLPSLTALHAIAVGAVEYD